MDLNMASPSPLPGERHAPDLHHYMLVVHPGAEVHDKVVAEQQYFRDAYGAKVLLKPMPHIGICSFRAKETMEDTLIRWIERICRERSGFAVTLNNYGGFPSHTIFLRILDERPFYKLSAELQVVNNYICSCGYPEVKLVRRPYLGIAGDLPDDIFSRAMVQYSRKSFHETFEANELLLLRKKDAYDPCRPVNIFRLQPPKDIPSIIFNQKIHPWTQAL